MYYVLSSTKLNQVRDDSLNHPRRPWGINGVTETATPSVMGIGGAASRRSPCSVLRLTGPMPTPAHSSCTASDATCPCPTTPVIQAVSYTHLRAYETDSYL